MEELSSTRYQNGPFSFIIQGVVSAEFTGFTDVVSTGYVVTFFGKKLTFPFCLASCGYTHASQASAL